MIKKRREMVKKFILSAILALFFTDMANAVPSYEADVRVDVMAENVTEAKKQAMAKAVRDALNEIVQSISTEQSVAELNELNDNQLQHFISGVMVLMEKSSDVRYIAELRVSINEKVLKAYMAENDMPFVVGEEQEVLVIPLLEQNGEPDLWSDKNIWRQAFIERGRIERGSLDVRVIDKNLGNIAAANAKRIYDMTDGEYNELADFNGISSVYVLKYIPADNVVFVKSFPEREVNEVKIESKTVAAAIEDVLPFLKGNTKVVSVAADSVSAPKEYDAVYTYPRLAEWAALKKMLEENPQVSEVTIVSMGNGKVRFRFVYSGVIEKLQANFGVKGYQMRNEGGYYAIN